MLPCFPDYSADPVQPFSVLHGNAAGFLHADAPDPGQLFRHAVDLAGVIALAPEGLRGHIGAVRFDDDPFNGNTGRHFDGLAGILKGQHPGKADVPAPV